MQRRSQQFEEFAFKWHRTVSELDGEFQLQRVSLSVPALTRLQGSAQYCSQGSPGLTEMLRTWEHALEGNPKSAPMADLLQEEEEGWP